MYRKLSAPQPEFGKLTSRMEQRNKNMWFRRRVLLLIFAIAICPSMHVLAADMQLYGTGDGDSRWFELFSNAFVQLDQGTGHPKQDVFFSVLPGASSPQQLEDFDPLTFDPQIFQPLGGSAIDVFPRDEAFDLGVATYDDQTITGSGFEMAAITGYDVDFAQNIADDDSVISRSYATTIGTVAGTFSFLDGQLIDAQLNVEITFTYDFSPQGGLQDYVGQFSLTGNQFDLFVDGSFSTGGSPLRYIWDSSGTVDQVLEASADSDLDLDVDGGDFLTWQRGFGSSGDELGPANGNFNGDTAVNAADLVVWQHQYGESGSGAFVTVAASVPEPSTLAGLGWILLFAFLGSRRWFYCLEF